jgi:RHS repeat-associated protein
MPQGSSPRTWESWFQTTGTGTIAALLGNTFRVRVGGQYQLQVITPGGTLNWTTPYPVTDNSWHLVEAVYDGTGTVTVYLDGVSLGVQSGAGTAGTATGLSVSGDANGVDQLLGAIDEVALYDSVLSGSQVANHFAASGDIRPTAPGAPTNVAATSGDGQATVTWTAPASNGGSAISSYTVTPYVGTSAQTPTSVSGSTTSLTTTAISNGTTYTFQVFATNAIGSGAAATSNAVTPAALPGSPRNVTATAADARAVVNWSTPAAPGNIVSSYTVMPYAGTTAQTTLAVTVTTLYGAGVDTTANVGGLTDGTRYTFQVTATNGTGTGPPGTSAGVTPIGVAPLKLAPGKGYSSASTPVQAVTADITGNGWRDIVTANGAGNNVSALLNQIKGGGHSGGTFAQPATLSAASAAASDIALGDFNGDGKLDMVVVSGTSSVGVMLGNGNGTFGPETVVQTLSNQNANVVAVADMNGDGKLDIVVAGGMIPYPWGTAIDVLLGNGDGTFQAPVQYQIHDVCLGCGFYSTGLALADLNGDGQIDIAYTNNNTSSGSDTGAMYALLNQGGGTFNVTSPYPTGTAIPGLHSSAPNETVAIADINGDGIPDVVTVEDAIYVDLNGSGGQRGISISFGKGDGTFLPPVYVRDPALTNGASPPSEGGDVVGLAMADMNGDGLPDIATADSNSLSGPGGVSVYLNRGGGSIDSPIFIPTGTFSPRGLSLGDMNGDSEPDVVLENNLAVGPNVPANVLVLLNGTDFPPLGGPLAAGEMHGCAMCQAMRGGGAVAVSGANPITVNSGEMSHTFTDLSIPARGYALSITQTYNDLNAGTDAGLGYGWWSPLFMSLTQDSGTGITTVTQENGGQAQFWTSSLQPVAPRTQATLLHNGDGTWTFTRYNSATFSFNSSGKITSMTDLTGDSLSFGYTGSQVTSLTHSDGRSLAIAWTSGHISSITDSNVAGTTRTVSLTYDGSNQLTDIDWKVNGANDRNEHFEYETAPWNHGMTGMRDPRGIWVTQVYDPVGRTTSQTVDPTSKDASGLNRTTTFAYTLSGGAIGLALITDPAGHQEQDTFAYGEMVQKITGYGTSSAATWTYSYDPSSVGTTMTIDPNGGVSSASYDTNGNPLASTDALGRTASSTYTGNGGADGQNNQPTTVTDPNGVTTTNTYDATHRTLTQTSTPLVGSSPAVSQVIQYQHANASHPGDVTVMIDGDGKAWTYGYDAFGNKSSTTDPVENKSSMAYNADGWVLTTITPMGDPSVCTSPCTPSQYTTTYSYVDGSGNTNFWGAATTVTDPLGHHTVKVYDSNNNVTQLTDGNGNVTAYDFDNANEPTVTHRADANHTTVTTDYNADGTVRDQIDGKGNTLQSYTYNSLGQQTAATADPGSSPHVNQTTAYTYDALGNVLTKQAPAGSCTGTVSGCTTYTYDAASQLTGITYSDGATPNVSTIQYDADGQRVGLTDGTGSWSWQYDSLRRLTSVTEGTNGTVAYQYNLRNEPTAITYPGTTGSVTRGYDNAGRWTSVQDWKGAQTTFGYDGNSNLQTQTTPTTGTSVVDTSAFNASDQLTSISSAQGATSVFSASYGRDGNGQVTSDTSATTSQNNYGYSPLNQLCYAGSNTTSACSSPPTGSQSFAYDASGNLTSLGSTTQAFNTADQMTTSGTSTYQYDSSGNRTGLTAGSSVTNYGYNQANRLCWTGPTASGSACNAGAQSSDTVYCYNATGLRMAKVTAGSCASPTTSEAFTWDVSAGLPLLLVDGSAQYVYGPGGLPLEQVNGAATLWYHHDQIGSTRAITDGAGALKATYTYDPYGNVLSCSGTAVTVGGVNVCTGTISVSNPLDFSGQYRDAESGYYYLRARYYDPTTAQFLTLDPWVTTTRSPYAYVAGNPLNGIDPSGLDPAWYERCVNAGICDGSGTDQGDAGKAYASWRVRFQWMAAEHIPRDDVPDPYESPTLGPNEWRSVCGNLWFVEGCVTFTGTGNCYLSGGLGIGVPGVAINGGATHGGTSDDLIGGPSAHAGGHYYGGGGYAQSPNGTGGAYWTIGTPGAGVYGSWGIKVP